MQEYMLDCPQKIGERKRTVEIDETKLCQRKYKGNPPVKGK
jgi:hypothetical protein